MPLEGRPYTHIPPQKTPDDGRSFSCLRISDVAEATRSIAYRGSCDDIEVHARAVYFSYKTKLPIAQASRIAFTYFMLSGNGIHGFLMVVSSFSFYWFT